jgi:hypothetical protein
LKSANLDSMKKNSTCLAFLALLLMPAFVFSQNNDGWIFKNEKNGIKVYYRKTSDVYELKLITSIQSSMAGLVSLLSDVESYPQWGYKITEAEFIRKHSETESIYRSRFDFPWPLDDRDIVMHNKVQQDPVSGKVTATSTATPSMSPERPDAVRIKDARTVWTIYPGSGGWLYVEYYVYSNPGGNLPDWLVNMALDVGPRETIQHIRQHVSHPRYQAARLSFIRG